MQQKTFIIDVEEHSGLAVEENKGENPTMEYHTIECHTNEQIVRVDNSTIGELQALVSGPLVERIKEIEAQSDAVNKEQGQQQKEIEIRQNIDFSTQFEAQISGTLEHQVIVNQKV